LPIHYITFMGLQRRLRSLHGSTPIVKRFSNENFAPSKGGQNGGFRELRGENVKVLFSNPEKAHPCAEPRRLTYYA